MSPQKRKVLNIGLITIGFVTIVLMVIKYSFAPQNLSAIFVTLEITMWILVLSAVFIVYSKLNEAETQLLDLLQILELKKAESEKRESDLLLRIMTLEEKDKEEQLLNLHKKKTLAKIYSSFDTRSHEELLKSLMPALAKVFELITGVLYWYNPNTSNYVPKATYALDETLEIFPFVENVGFCGQAVAEKKIITLDEIPDDYWEAKSGLGGHPPKYLQFIPIEVEGKILGVLELGSFKHLEINKIWGDINKKIEDINKSI